MLQCRDLLSTPILGPWLASPGTSTRHRQVYLSLVHWVEAAKFMPHRPELRDRLLFSPTHKEVRKFAREHQNAWRSDWPVSGPCALLAGVASLALQRPEMGLRSCAPGELAVALSGIGLSPPIAAIWADRFELWRRAPRISVFGATRAPPALVGARLMKLVAPLSAWTLVATCNQRAAWGVHDWALAQWVPVHYVGAPCQRSGRALARAVIGASNQVVVFEQRTQRHFDQVLHEAKASGRQICLELFGASNAECAQLSLS